MPRIFASDHSPAFGGGALSALITGASSGLGAALALALARPGATLHLGGRDAARLDAVAARCRARGAAVAPRLVAVGDAAAMEDWIGGLPRLDLAIANAGISGGTDRSGLEPDDQARAVFETNLLGALDTLLPAARLMRTQAAGADGVRGRLAAIASIAAFLPAPVAPSYAASKAALDSWLLGNAAGWARHGILATSVCPGFIRSPMTALNTFPMPGLMDADRAAGLALAGIAAGRRRVIFPRWLGGLARASDLLPPRVLAKLTERGGKPTGLHA